MYTHVKYELHELERLIATGVSRVEEPDGNVYHQFHGRDTIKKEIERIRHRFVQKVFTFEDEGHLERYVQYHQQALTCLMDETFCLLNPHVPDHYTILEELLTFIERHFAKYFDRNVKAPERYIAQVRKEIAKNLKTIELQLNERHAGARIRDIVLYPLRKYISDDPNMEWTYRAIEYVREMQKELLKIIDASNPADNIDSHLYLVLYYINYNSKKCFTYFTDHITEVISQAETYGEKIEKLAFILKQVNQAPVKPGLCYHQYAPSLKCQLTDYISEEIDYIERLQGLAASQPSPVTENLYPKFKLKLEMSVSQLAFFVKVLLDANIIRNKNIAELLRFVASIAMTKRSEKVSIGSLRGKFYDVERSTKESVRQMLVNLISCVDKNA